MCVDISKTHEGSNMKILEKFKAFWLLSWIRKGTYINIQQGKIRIHWELVYLKEQLPLPSLDQVYFSSEFLHILGAQLQLHSSIKDHYPSARSYKILYVYIIIHLTVERMN